MTSNEPNWTTYALTADPGKHLREAKATIATLTGDIEMLNGIIKGLRQMLADVEPAKEAAERELHQHHELFKLVVEGATRVSDQRDVLRAERDEARRYACENNQCGLSHRQLAKIKGWDCFDLENGNA